MLADVPGELWMMYALGAGIVFVMPLYGIWSTLEGILKKKES